MDHVLYWKNVLPRHMRVIATIDMIPIAYLTVAVIILLREYQKVKG